MKSMSNVIMETAAYAIMFTLETIKIPKVYLNEIQLCGIGFEVRVYNWKHWLKSLSGQVL